MEVVSEAFLKKLVAPEHMITALSLQQLKSLLSLVVKRNTFHNFVLKPILK